MVRRLDHSQQQRHAAVVARTMETLGSIIEKTTNISSAAADPPLSSSRGSGQPAELRRRGEGRARRGEGELLASRAGANGAQWHSVASGGNGFSELSDREIVGQLCAHLDLPNRSDLLPFGIRVRRTYIEAVVAHLWHIWRKFHLGFWGGCWGFVGGGRGKCPTTRPQ